MTAWGIDISNHQAGADLARAKAAGCTFVFVKATEGGTYRDPYFAGFQAQARSLGLPLGAYHFARPGNGRSGAQEAEFFLSVVGARLGELPPVLDLEDTGLTARQTVAWALDFLTTVKTKTGVTPMVYTYTAFARAHLGDGSGLAAYPLWLADYRTGTNPEPPAPAPWGKWHVWQHTSSATVPGIPGNCDRNITDLTPSQLQGLAANPTVKDDLDMTPAERQKLIDDIATAVVNKPVVRPGNTPVSLGIQVGGANINAYRALQILKTQDQAQLVSAITAAVAAAQPGVDVDSLAKAIVVELGKD